ncbi:MAG: hypothetical protein V7606_3394 [Burkholderiales bacterium]|jgi:hypothetical protein|nr:hypothetical protein [Burkholderia sp.]
MMPVILISASAALLAACGEFDQAKTADRYLPDTAPWQGAKNSFVAQGWKPGEKATWDAQLRARAQHQNEYLKAN